MAWVVRGEFRKLWIGQLVSATGSAVTRVALPLVAVVTLHASALEMGALSALAIAPHLVFGLHAGVWVDRWSLRRVLICTDIGALVLLGSVPAAAALRWLRIEQLYVVAVLTGLMALLSDTASQTMIPALVPREDLMRANSAALLNFNLAGTLGPSAAGVLVQVLPAPFAILIDAASYVVSTVTAYLIREPERPPARPRSEVRVSAGLRVLFGHGMLRPLVVSAAIAAMAGAMLGPLVVLFLIRELHLPAAFVGLNLTVSGAAAVAGTFVATGWCNRVGLGRCYLSGTFLASLNGVALFTGSVPVILLGSVFAGLGMSLFGVPQRTLRQALASEGLVGQVTASWRTLVIGGQTVGAVVSGALATALGIRPTLLIVTAGMLCGLLIAVLSPLRGLRDLPAVARSFAQD
ncbi:MFS transporter [Kribbella jejuensis]|uniref:Putative MFS family arabinose efflux permease n=1 Tax=Kribbella jejuensis TaxID=236068 RepID=A0A542EAI5_9ACTN|nr:MFS transporter [Kribbella jejuensis]TQJ12344.1 putative MFS family arabinose efflux permease [Kribbella jejuensis]